MELASLLHGRNGLEVRKQQQIFVIEYKPNKIAKALPCYFTIVVVIRYIKWAFLESQKGSNASLAQTLVHMVGYFFLISVKDAFGNLQAYALLFYCIYLTKIIFYYYFSQRMKGKLITQIDTILQDLKKQNNQISLTLKSMKKVKSQDIIPTKASKSVIDYTMTEKTNKHNNIQEMKTRKSKAFHRCTSCKIISNKNCHDKQNKEMSKQKEVNTKKTKTLSLLQIQRKSTIQKARSPTRKSTITMKYVGVLNAKKTKRL